MKANDRVHSKVWGPGRIVRVAEVRVGWIPPYLVCFGDAKRGWLAYCDRSDLAPRRTMLEILRGWVTRGGELPLPCTVYPND